MSFSFSVWCSYNMKQRLHLLDVWHRCDIQFVWILRYLSICFLIEINLQSTLTFYYPSIERLKGCSSTPISLVFCLRVSSSLPTPHLCKATLVISFGVLQFYLCQQHCLFCAVALFFWKGCYDFFATCLECILHPINSL